MDKLTGRSINGKFLKKDDLKTLVYARVNTSEQKDDLQRQANILEIYCPKKGMIIQLSQI